MRAHSLTPLAHTRVQGEPTGKQTERKQTRNLFAFALCAHTGGIGPGVLVLYGRGGIRGEEEGEE